MRFAKLVCGVLAVWGAAASSSPAIYRCEVEGVITFSDRPCDASARPYAPDSSRISTYEAPAVQQSRRAQPRKSRRAASGSDGDSLAKRAAACDKLQSALQDIRIRMRAGYSAKEGERLRQRQQKLRARWRADKCR